ncbi:MAG: hypothetical protein LBH18_02955 [Spirochaetaceae bacterium]|jgi:hypothetical protein|nr:hypothetical protein [Spirochaetaceae bacterium]
MKKTFFYTLAVILALWCVGCKNGGNEEVQMPSTPKLPDRNRPTVEGLRLKTLSLYYQNDAAMNNLLKPALNNNSGDYFVPDADASQGAVTVFAEAETEGLKLNITWTQGSAARGGMAKDETQTGSATISGVPVPTAGAANQVNTQVTIQVSDGSKTYDYTVAIQAPGANASLDSLWMIYGESGSPTEKYLLWKDGGTEIAFTHATYDYTIEIKDAAKKNTPLLVSASAASANSAIKLTENGVEVKEISPPPASVRKSDSLTINGRIDGSDIAGGSGGGTAPIITETPPENSETAAKYYKIMIPEAGSDAVKLVFTVENSAVSSVYTVTLVPPQKTGDGSAEDGRLSNLQMQYTGSTEQCLKDFKPDTTSYTINSIPRAAQNSLKITSLVPVYAKANVVVTYIYGSNPNDITTVSDFKNTEIPLPKINDTLTVKIKVGAKDRAVEYSVAFKNPSQTKLWNGTVELSGSSANDYKIIGIDAVTTDGKPHNAAMSGSGKVSWSLMMDETRGAPVSFVVRLQKNKDASIYLLTNEANGIKSGVSFPITFNVNDPNNVIYLEVKNASQLANMDPAGNYYLAADIVLDSQSLSKDWKGPEKYKGHFNGNGKTITLELSKPSGDTGLFDSLASGAVIENFDILVKTKVDSSGYLKISDSSHFGGVVGTITPASNESGNYTLKNISINGSLKYNAENGYLLAGGLIGEIGGYIGKVEIENCRAVLLNMELISSSKGSGTLGLGGLIGKSAAERGAVSVTNCHTGGKISGNVSSDRDLFAGGIMGDIGQAGGINIHKEELSVKNCYSTMSIDLKNNSSNNNNRSIAGGLIGYYRNINQNTLVSASVARNDKVTAVSAKGAAYANRVIGFIESDNKGKLDKNYALSTMLTGATVSGGTANNVNGEGKTLAELSTQKTWTDIGFKPERWDFSSVDKDGCPKL